METFEGSRPHAISMHARRPSTRGSLDKENDFYFIFGDIRQQIICLYIVKLHSECEIFLILAGMKRQFQDVLKTKDEADDGVSHLAVQMSRVRIAMLSAKENTHVDDDLISQLIITAIAL